MSRSKNRITIAIKRRVYRFLYQTKVGFRVYLFLQYRTWGPGTNPIRQIYSKVLLNIGEVEHAVREVDRLKLPPSHDRHKTWDNLVALDLILRSVPKDGLIYDAGGAEYSILPVWLFLYGYQNVFVGNIEFENSFKRGSIQYIPEDITNTAFDDESVDAVSSISVIEHGVDLTSFLLEMSRILKPNGVLITSTDYWPTSIDTRGQSAFGVPIHIFNQSELEDFIKQAKQVGFELIDIPDLSTEQKVVRWTEYGLSYTFVVLSFRKIT